MSVQTPFFNNNSKNILADIKLGDEVIVPSYTFVSSALAFVRQGAKIIFVRMSASKTFELAVPEFSGWTLNLF